MSTDVVAELAHEGVAVSMPILLFGGCRVGAPPRGAAVEHLCVGRAGVEVGAARKGGRPRGPWQSNVAAARQRLFV